MPGRVRKEFRIGLAGLEPHAGARKRVKISLQINFDNPKSSIKLESAHDPNLVPF